MAHTGAAASLLRVCSSRTRARGPAKDDPRAPTWAHFLAAAKQQAAAGNHERVRLVQQAAVRVAAVHGPLDFDAASTYFLGRDAIAEDSTGSLPGRRGAEGRVPEQWTTKVIAGMERSHAFIQKKTRRSPPPTTASLAGEAGAAAAAVPAATIGGRVPVSRVRDRAPCPPELLTVLSVRNSVASLLATTDRWEAVPAQDEAAELAAHAFAALLAKQPQLQPQLADGVTAHGGSVLRSSRHRYMQRLRAEWHGLEDVPWLRRAIAAAEAATRSSAQLSPRRACLILSRVEGMLQEAGLIDERVPHQGGTPRLDDLIAVINDALQLPHAGAAHRLHDEGMGSDDEGMGGGGEGVGGGGGGGGGGSGSAAGGEDAGTAPHSVGCRAVQLAALALTMTPRADDFDAVTSAMWEGIDSGSVAGSTGGEGKGTDEEEHSGSSSAAARSGGRIDRGWTSTPAVAAADLHRRWNDITGRRTRPGIYGGAAAEADALRRLLAQNEQELEAIDAREQAAQKSASDAARVRSMRGTSDEDPSPDKAESIKWNEPPVLEEWGGRFSTRRVLRPRSDGAVGAAIRDDDDDEDMAALNRISKFIDSGATDEERRRVEKKRVSDLAGDIKVALSSSRERRLSANARALATRLSLVHGGLCHLRRATPLAARTAPPSLDEAVSISTHVQDWRRASERSGIVSREAGEAGEAGGAGAGGAGAGGAGAGAGGL